MPSIKFNCPRCTQSIEAPSDLCGQTIECPTCQVHLCVPQPTSSEKRLTLPTKPRSAKVWSTLRSYWGLILALLVVLSMGLSSLGRHSVGPPVPAQKMIASPAPTPPEVVWNYSTTTSPMDDSRDDFLYCDAVDVDRSMPRNYTPALCISYKENRLRVYIATSLFLGVAGKSIDVTCRLGTNPPSTAKWGISDKSNALFWEGDASYFVRALLGSNQLLVRFEPFGGNPVTIKFNLDGLSKAIEPMESVLL